MKPAPPLWWMRLQPAVKGWGGASRGAGHGRVLRAHARRRRRFSRWGGVRIGGRGGSSKWQREEWCAANRSTSEIGRDETCHGQG
eukprot:808929-Pleurochrysis_carterae.AAC.1